ncbi:threonine/serine exporter family protein [Ammoniphilus sp. YIM 78166]|uniref:threonine/serine exporter family protein n=1 Tax=Ammoniphilus sp. YIM 78166 TaxID=1644106 RepID=UPI002105D014|nr:threonine/serine exporter family protein [Ammoniphilus sp. YIM 78166]
MLKRRPKRMWEQLITSFIASATFAILFNAPRRTLFICGLVGMVGWIIYFELVLRQYDYVPATLIAAMVISVLCQIFAKLYKTPIIIYSVAGIIPLVPGGLAYDATRKFVENDYSLAVQLAAKALMISGSIAIGLIFSEVLMRISLRGYAYLKNN